MSVAVTISTTKCPSEDNESTTSDVENDKELLRKAVKGVFNNFYGVYIYMHLYVCAC